MVDTPTADPPQPEPPRRWLLKAVRYALPAVVALAGVVMMCLGGESHLEGGAGIISAGLAVYFINWLFRVGAAGDDERAAEQSAREYFSAHGHWPGEGAPEPGTPATVPSTPPAPLATRRSSRIGGPRRPRR
jgi:hypothetical protein